MAHYSVTVCLPPEAATDLDAALATALAPFGEAATELDWDFGALWDNWRIAGSSDHFGFWIRPGCTDDPRLIHDGPDWRTGAPRLTAMQATCGCVWPEVSSLIIRACSNRCRAGSIGSIRA